MNDERTFLAFIHKTAAMGVGTLPQAMGLPQSRAMVPVLQDQLRECRTIAARGPARAPAPAGRKKPPPATKGGGAGLLFTVLSHTIREHTSSVYPAGSSRGMPAISWAWA